MAALIMLMGISFIIGWIIGSIFLLLGLKLAGTPEEKLGFGSVMITALLASLVESFIPIIGCIIAWYIIKIRHTDSWGKAILAWLISIIIPAIIIGTLYFIWIIPTYAVAPPGY